MQDRANCKTISGNLGRNQENSRISFIGVGNLNLACGSTASVIELALSSSITIDENGGIFDIPNASAFLIFPPNAVEEQVTLTCERVMYKDCQVKAKEGEAFVSRILKLQPEGIAFKKPVTVLLTHSAYEDQEFLDFYELTMETLSPTRQELYTEGISNMETATEELRAVEDLYDWLPYAKADITETCTIVAAIRAKVEQILIKRDECFVFSHKYGENTKLDITFPKGVVDEELWLTVQLFPADDVFDCDEYLNKNLVCLPVIKVSGQNKPFLKPVHVSLTYTHKDVVNIHENLLPARERKHQFTTEYGWLLRSQQKSDDSKWMRINDDNEVYIERPKENQLKLSFSVKHFRK